MTRWRIAGIENVTLVADDASEETATLVEEAAAKAGVSISRIDLMRECTIFIDSVGWRSATSEEYKTIPHQYTVRMRETEGKPPNEDGFNWFAGVIREYGYKRPFTNPVTGRTYTYRYFDAQDGDGVWHKYWHMVGGGGFIINREPKPEGPYNETIV